MVSLKPLSSPPRASVAGASPEPRPISSRRPASRSTRPWQADGFHASRTQSRRRTNNRSERRARKRGRGGLTGFPRVRDDASGRTPLPFLLHSLGSAVEFETRLCCCPKPRPVTAIGSARASMPIARGLASGRTTDGSEGGGDDAVLFSCSACLSVYLPSADVSGLCEAVRDDDGLAAVHGHVPVDNLSLSASLSHPFLPSPQPPRSALSRPDDDGAGPGRSILTLSEAIVMLAALFTARTLEYDAKQERPLPPFPQAFFLFFFVLLLFPLPALPPAWLFSLTMASSPPPQSRICRRRSERARKRNREDKRGWGRKAAVQEACQPLIRPSPLSPPPSRAAGRELSCPPTTLCRVLHVGLPAATPVARDKAGRCDRSKIVARAGRAGDGGTSVLVDLFSTALRDTQATHTHRSPSLRRTVHPSPNCPSRRPKPRRRRERRVPSLD
ncbi:hypothetical protein CDD83_9280 [Cordyceps sp. RAO-2017]|nr:hypothetical protein CDD83_9280 [Cordyceps sp. RAO-2017]